MSLDASIMHDCKREVQRDVRHVTPLTTGDFRACFHSSWLVMAATSPPLASVRLGAMTAGAPSSGACNRYLRCVLELCY
jgi:hypothetical protein